MEVESGERDGSMTNFGRQGSLFSSIEFVASPPLSTDVQLSRIRMINIDDTINYDNLLVTIMKSEFDLLRYHFECIF